MNGAIFYASKYGSTLEYAGWIADATGLPVYDADEQGSDPADSDFLVLGSPIIYYKLLLSRWMHRNLDVILSKPAVLFTVSGAPAGKKLDRWIRDCLSPALVRHMHHVALRGRQNPKDLTWFDRSMLIVAGLMNSDRQAAQEEMNGFDYMDRASIQPIVDLIKDLQAANGPDQQDGLSALAGHEHPA